MRILVVQESDWLERGPHQSHHLMERMVQRGHEVHVIDYEVDWLNNFHEGIISPKMIKKDFFKVIPPGVTVIRPQIIRLPVLNYVSLLVSHRLAIEREIRDFKPDVIIGFGLLNARMAIGQSIRHEIPYVYYIIDELHRLVPEDIFQPIAKFIEKGNDRRSAKVISINEALKDYCLEMGADQSKTTVIRAGVDYERFAKADGTDIRNLYGISKDDTLLFFMGWLYDFSGLDEVAIEMARSDNKKLKLMVLGKGELMDRLKEIRETERLRDRLIIEDWRPYSEIPKYLAAADICILPAKPIRIMENIVPIKMYEYLAAGKVVFSTDLKGIRKEFQENNGILYMDRATDAVKLANELISNDEVKNLGKMGQKFVEGHDWEKIIVQFEEILNDSVRSGMSK